MQNQVARNLEVFRHDIKVWFPRKFCLHCRHLLFDLCAEISNLVTEGTIAPLSQADEEDFLLLWMLLSLLWWPLCDVLSVHPVKQLCEQMIHKTNSIRGDCYWRGCRIFRWIREFKYVLLEQLVWTFVVNGKNDLLQLQKRRIYVMSAKMNTKANIRLTQCVENSLFHPLDDDLGFCRSWLQLMDWNAWLDLSWLQMSLYWRLTCELHFFESIFVEYTSDGEKYEKTDVSSWNVPQITHSRNRRPDKLNVSRAVEKLVKKRSFHAENRRFVSSAVKLVGLVFEFACASASAFALVELDGPSLRERNCGCG